ncbi:site-specific integrase [Magnetospirillum molischianum]|uniref:Phage integrase family protein n=1 Tax=Magnetospirillum molischianum DSM 120 TaxID=1150626 RepID=H8FWN8_MAGML|nr:site-specific integrase [Magnetospirillum molischianum]CCG42776.1 Phage integrase family protein [Magnetospirillum molischianum DSM 120]
MAKLTKRVVDQIAPGDTESMHWDDELKGFGLRVWPSGRKVYMVMSRVKGRLRRITIGPHGAITPEQARIRAHKILAEAKAGRDPALALELDQARKAPTVKGLGERFLKEHVAVRCKPSTQAEYKRSVELFINPKIGTRKVTDIERRDIAEMHQSLSHIPYQANRTLGVLSKMFNLAEVWGLRPDGSNPCLHVKKYVERKRERFLSTDEFAALGTALREAEADGPETQSAITAIRLLMLTGCRLSEIMTLKWEYVDTRARELRLPDSKTGAKVVHFGQTAAAILDDIERLDDNPFVITGKKPGSRLTDLQHPWRRIRDKAGLSDVRIHDLRHSYASGALALGEGLPMIGKLLGHSQVQTTARYAHLANDPVKRAAGRVSDTIGIALLGAPKHKSRGQRKSAR